MLFLIQRYPTANGEAIRNLSELGRLILRTEDYAWFMRLPTGVEYDESQPEPWQTAEYKTLCSEDMITKIIAGAYALETVETPEVLSSPKTLISWESAVTDEGMSDNFDYTFPDGAMRAYTPDEHILLLNGGFSAGKVIERPGNSASDMYVEKAALPKELLTADAEKSTREVDGALYISVDAIGKSRTLGGAYSYTDDGYPFFGGGHGRICLTDNLLLFIGDEKPGEGAELLGGLKEKLNASYNALENAFNENAASIGRGQFADWPEDAVAASLSALKRNIGATSYVTTLGNFAVFNGPYTILWDVTEGKPYFYVSYHGGGSVYEADFDDLNLLLPIYFSN
jgi:hypothetical protein